MRKSKQKDWLVTEKAEESDRWKTFYMIFRSGKPHKENLKQIKEISKIDDIIKTALLNLSAVNFLMLIIHSSIWNNILILLVIMFWPFYSLTSHCKMLSRNASEILPLTTKSSSKPEKEWRQPQATHPLYSAGSCWYSWEVGGGYVVWTAQGLHKPLLRPVTPVSLINDWIMTKQSTLSLSCKINRCLVSNLFRYSILLSDHFKLKLLFNLWGGDCPHFPFYPK